MSSKTIFDILNVDPYAIRIRMQSCGYLQSGKIGRRNPDRTHYLDSILKIIEGR